MNDQATMVIADNTSLAECISAGSLNSGDAPLGPKLGLIVSSSPCPCELTIDQIGWPRATTSEQVWGKLFRTENYPQASGMHGFIDVDQGDANMR